MKVCVILVYTIDLYRRAQEVCPLAASTLHYPQQAVSVSV